MAFSLGVQNICMGIICVVILIRPTEKVPSAFDQRRDCHGRRKLFFRLSLIKRLAVGTRSSEAKRTEGKVSTVPRHLFLA
jgi:hypothetical protein